MRCWFHADHIIHSPLLFQVTVEIRVNQMVRVHFPSTANHPSKLHQVSKRSAGSSYRVHSER